MNREPKPVDPLNVGLVLHDLDRAYNKLTEVCLGYNASKRNMLMKNIVNLLLMLRRNDSKEILENINNELDKYLDKYKQEYGWLHENEC